MTCFLAHTFLLTCLFSAGANETGALRRLYFPTPHCLQKIHGRDDNVEAKWSEEVRVKD